MISAAASLGALLLWDVDGGLTQIDKFLYSTDNYIKAGALLAVGVLNTGDANLIDSRLIHAGGGNDSTKRRVLFYVSFRRRGKVTPSGSLLYKFRRAGYTLDNVEEWNKEAALPEPVA